LRVDGEMLGNGQRAVSEGRDATGNENADGYVSDGNELVWMCAKVRREDYSAGMLFAGEVERALTVRTLLELCIGAVDTRQVIAY